MALHQCPRPQAPPCEGGAARVGGRRGAFTRPRLLSRVQAAAAPRFSDIQQADEYHVLAQAEIPVHIPRPDFLKQLYRWAVQYADDGEDVNRAPMRCDVIDVSSTLSVGFTVSVLAYDPDGKLVSEVDLECIMDDEIVAGYDVVGMDDSGFPKLQTMDGEEKLVRGKKFLIRRDKSKPVPPHHVQTVKKFLSETFEAVNKYYSFGSCFSEEF